MGVTFDPKKSAENVTLAGRAGLSFDKAAEFDFSTAILADDTRDHPVTGKPYPERRVKGIGKMGRRVVAMVFTPTADGFRVNSLRPASKKERATWLADQA